MELEALKEIGLSTNEAKVYRALIMLGSAPVTEITKKSGVFRSNAYDALDRLIEKGLVSCVTKHNKKIFEVAHPKNLFEILKEKESALNKMMPTLIAEYEEKKTKQNIYNYKGMEGIKTVLRDINTSKEYDAFGISSNLAKVVPYYFPHWIKERLNKGLFARMIKAKGDKLATAEIVGTENYRKMFHVRELPEEFYTPAATFIYGDKVAIIVEKMGSPVAIVIENKEIAEGYRKQFKALWNIAEEEDIKSYESK